MQGGHFQLLKTTARDSWRLKECVGSILQMLPVKMTVVTNDCPLPFTEKNARKVGRGSLGKRVLPASLLVRPRLPQKTND